MKRQLFILLLIAIATTAWGAPSFTVHAPSEVAVGNKFAVTFRLANGGDGSGLKAPSINGCTLIFGPSVSTMQSYQVVNGRTSSSSTVDYTFTYRADRTGSYTIGSASINVDGKTLRSPETRIKVVEAAPGSTPGYQRQQPQRPQPRAYDLDDVTTHTADRGVNANDVFIRVILSKPQIYEQEAVECTIKLYTKYNISSFMATQQPTFDGFLTEELQFQPQINTEETYQGQRYATAVLKKCILFPQKSGKLTINPGRYELNVVQYNPVSFGIFQRMEPVERKMQVNSNAASVNVLPLPSPQPEGFTGAVGQFTIDSQLKQSSFRTGEAASLIYTIKGTGNIKYVKPPVIDFPTEFEQYTPNTDIKAQIDGNNVTGSMTIEYTFVPQAVGQFTIGSDKFVYFNPSTKEYVTLSTPTYNIKVAQGTRSTADRKEITAKNTDILHIALGDKGQSHSHTLVALTWWYWALYLLLIIGLVIGIKAGSQRVKLNADITGRKMAQANKVARKRLRVAEQLMREHKSEQFYEETLRALWGYLSDKLGMPTSQLTRENIAQELLNHGASQQLADQYIALIDECEMARYTPSQSDEHIGDIYTRASEAMNTLASLKTSKRKSS